MSALATFDFDDNPVRTIRIDGDVWFVGKDVCRCLDIVNHSQALARLADDERRDGVCITDPIGREQTPILINEPGVYRLIFESRKPEAERFRRWVFHEVLPQIRQNGGYVASHVDLDAITEKMRIVREARLTHGRKAAQELWAYLGLPDVPDEVRAEPEGKNDLLVYVLDFLEECTVKDASAAVQSHELYRLYLRWATAAKAPLFNVTMFGHMVRRSHLHRHRSNGQTLYRGIRIKPEARSELQGGGG